MPPPTNIVLYHYYKLCLANSIAKLITFSFIGNPKLVWIVELWKKSAPDWARRKPLHRQ